VLEKKLRMTIKESIFPPFCTRRKELYDKIDAYVRHKLSLDYILKESDEFDRLKMYMFNKDEVYVFDNIDRFRSSILNGQIDDKFESEKFKKAYQTISNQKLVDVLFT
jgi:hypothetical protein